MPTQLSFDELNRLNGTESSSLGYKIRSMPFEQYFGEMDLTDRQKNDRIELASKLREIVLIVIALIIAEEQYGVVDKTAIRSQLQTDYVNTVRPYVDDTKWVEKYSKQYAKDFVKATFDHTDDAWYTSDDRATYNAENEANTSLNHQDFTTAKNRGFTYKRWRSMKDSRVRKTHREVDDTRIPIDDFFQVGEAKMLYPKDVVNAGDHPEEIANCRCSVVYMG